MSEQSLPPTLESGAATTWYRDFIAGLIVFLVALPLCLGIALASGAPLFSGLIAGIIGGIVVGFLSGSHTSVSGPAAGLTAVVAAEIVALGSYESFLVAVVIAGVIQITMGLLRAGGIAAFIPTAVIKGLLAAIGLILVLKQLPHLLGHDTDPDGEMSFAQPDHENTFSELISMMPDIQVGAAVIGLVSLALLLAWDRVPKLKKALVPAPLFVVILGVLLQLLFAHVGSTWVIESSHLVQVPIAEHLSDLTGLITSPRFSDLGSASVWFVGLTIAIVASLETLLNLEAIDRLDPRQRHSPPNRELVAQGMGNILCGLTGGLPVTSVIVRSSVNINACADSKRAAILHGLMLLVSVVALPHVLNLIPLSCLAAILIATGMKLASPTLVKQMWEGGRYQFLPFVMTVAAIVLTDLLIGILLGLGISLLFIVHSNLRRPLKQVLEKHMGGDVLHIEFANTLSFLNRGLLDRTLEAIPRGSQVLLDASSTVYIDPDIVSMLHEFRDQVAPARGIKVSLRGFRNKHQIKDEIQYIDHSTREFQTKITPQQVLQILKDGNERFRNGQHLARDYGRQMNALAQGQHPIAVILCCIDSRSPAELVFDLGLGDIFSVRVAGNVVSPKVLGSIEYACAVAGAKLVLVLGHTRCGAVTAAVQFKLQDKDCVAETGCQNLGAIVHDIQQAIHPQLIPDGSQCRGPEFERCVDDIARHNVQCSVTQLLEKSSTLKSLNASGRINVLGAMYDITTGKIEFFESERP